MDPTVALENIRAAIDEGRVDDAADMFSDLDLWLKRGGFLPADWTTDRRR